uniref:KH domain-containing RNA-binding protein QKI n=1 Tax=Saimiri boliviensis boliviensis TaxID=39432 RepID=A0A2K6V8V6_SAIBB
MLTSASPTTQRRFISYCGFIPSRNTDAIKEEAFRARLTLPYCLLSRRARVSLRFAFRITGRCQDRFPGGAPPARPGPPTPAAPVVRTHVRAGFPPGEREAPFRRVAFQPPNKSRTPKGATAATGDASRVVPSATKREPGTPTEGAPRRQAHAAPPAWRTRVSPARAPLLRPLSRACPVRTPAAPRSELFLRVGPKRGSVLGGLVPRVNKISRVRKDMYNDTLNGSTEKRSAELPDAVGPIVQLQEKLYVPVKEYPDFKLVGRILGPRGLTAKQLEAETGCKIMVRGKGSMRDKKKEEQNRGKPNWEHLNEDLHVLITVEDAQNRAEIKLKRAVEEVKKLLVPAAEGEDSLKKMQLMELAILNGTYRDANIKSPTAQAAPRIITGPAPVLPPAALRTPTPAGPTIMPLIRQIQTAVMPNGTPHPTAAIVPPGPEAGLIYTPYEYPYTLAPATSILEYPIEPSGVLGAVATKVRRHDMRVHPYQRIVTADRAATGN